jgi:hypothetical protein
LLKLAEIIDPQMPFLMDATLDSDRDVEEWMETGRFYLPAEAWQWR